MTAGKIIKALYGRDPMKAYIVKNISVANKIMVKIDRGCSEGDIIEVEYDKDSFESYKVIYSNRDEIWDKKANKWNGTYYVGLVPLKQDFTVAHGKKVLSHVLEAGRKVKVYPVRTEEYPELIAFKYFHGREDSFYNLKKKKFVKAYERLNWKKGRTYLFTMNNSKHVIYALCVDEMQGTAVVTNRMDNTSGKDYFKEKPYSVGDMIELGKHDVILLSETSIDAYNFHPNKEEVPKCPGCGTKLISCYNPNSNVPDNWICCPTCGMATLKG